MNKVIVANILLFILILLSLFLLLSQISIFIALSVDSEGQAARISYRFLTVTLTNPHKDNVIWNYPVFPIFLGVLLNGYYYFHSRKKRPDAL